MFIRGPANHRRHADVVPPRPARRSRSYCFRRQRDRRRYASCSRPHRRDGAAGRRFISDHHHASTPARGPRVPVHQVDRHDQRDDAVDPFRRRRLSTVSELPGASLSTATLLTHPAQHRMPVVPQRSAEDGLLERLGRRRRATRTLAASRRTETRPASAAASTRSVAFHGIVAPPSARRTPPPTASSTPRTAS